MSEDSKSFEKKLDRDFLFYLDLTKTLFENITEDTEKQLCEVWLTHLVGKTICNLSEKCDRNIYLSRLLLQMQNGKLQGVFRESPPSGTLPCAFTTFGLPSDVEGLKRFEEVGFQLDATTGASGDLNESSRDGRTYLATKQLPDGMMAFLAVTNNEEEDVWVPQQSPVRSMASSKVDKPGSSGLKGFVKKLGQIVGVPIYQLRKSPEDRERVMQWMDKVINDCNKWIQGEDPHNTDLEVMFEWMYNDYACDPEKSEILKHPTKLRTILIKDIRDKVFERRAEMTRRELILDQYEADEFVEERIDDEDLDDVWLHCAKKPLSESVKHSLESIYPPEVVTRFTELLHQERINIINKGEKEARKKIAELRSGSLEDIKKELLRLKKLQEDYKDYYRAYKEIEEKKAEFEKEYREKNWKSDKSDQESNNDIIKREIQFEIDQAIKRFEKERRTQNELNEKLEEARDTYSKVMERMKLEEERFCCERNQLQEQMDDLEYDIRVQTNRRNQLQQKLMCMNGK